MRLKKKYFLATILGFLIFFSSQVGNLSNTKAAVASPQLKTEINFFLNQSDTSGYLLWQYSGTTDPAGIIGGDSVDSYSFYGNGTVCATLKEMSQSLPSGKFLGVNVHALSNHLDKLNTVLDDLENNCGTSVIRIFGTSGNGGPGAVKSVLDAAASKGMKVIVAADDYSNIIGPANPDPTNWYRSGYRTTYLPYVLSLARTIGGNPGLFAIELANEPHCSGVIGCVPYYNSWVADVSSQIKAINSSIQVSIGQMGNNTNNRGDSPPPGDYKQSNSVSTIDIGSGHYYTTGERTIVQQAQSQAQSLGKSFYIGEASSTLVVNDNTSTGGNQPPIQTPKPDPFVPCDEVRLSQGNTEFHSLRPYQSSPCNTQMSDEALYCGNDLIVKKTFTVTPSQGTCTSFWPDGSPKTCNFTFDNTINSTNISVDLSNAKFPIMGNTENVPNEYGQGVTPQATDTQKVNEYVSWYLQGSKQKAEEPLTNVQGTDDADTNSDAYKLVNLTGPLRRLLPERLQRVQRYSTIVKATKGMPPPKANGAISDMRIGALNPTLQKESHDETVGCMNNGNGEVFPCTTNTDESERIRLSFFLNKLVGPGGGSPLLEEFPAYQTNGQFDFYKFWQAYLTFNGNPVCIIYGFLCPTDPVGRAQANIFLNIPFSSTEDRLGQTYTNNGLVIDPNLVSQPQSDSQVSNVEFVPTNTKHRLYFAHMQESSELATLIQNTFLPKGVTAFDPSPPSQTFYNSQRCEIKDARSNPGDNLFGNFTQPANSPISGDQTIAGKISYTVKFTCEFPQPTPNQSCINDCIFNLSKAGLPTNTCSSQCPPIQPTCTRTSLTALSIYTQTPKINDVWQQLVEGPSSVFKRIFPQVSPNAPVTEIKDVPGVTQASYSTSSDEVLAGDPGANRAGSQAQLFFPHIGGIYDYFLKDIQTALRPYGVAPDSPGTTAQVSPVSSSVDPGQCRSSIWSGIPIDGFPGPIADAFRAASAKFNIPTCVLTAIASIEGSTMRNLSNTEAQAIARPWTSGPQAEIPDSLYPGLLNKINCYLNSAGAIGPMQITIDSWNGYQDASQGYLGTRVPDRCNAADAIFATAKFLVNGRLPIYGFPAGSGWSDPRKFCAAGQTNYGSCRLDRPTCNNLGTNYCDFLLNYCKGSVNLPSSAKCSDYFPTDPR
ncbi:MAG: cellulase family glycosylhydrolase [Candidatus Woesebacteria bacterium]|nr:MAG: cellulase family glycosylhydrolase [Candidatus Woesebacteria bacterium]